MNTLISRAITSWLIVAIVIALLVLAGCGRAPEKVAYWKERDEAKARASEVMGGAVPLSGTGTTVYPVEFSTPSGARCIVIAGSDSYRAGVALACDWPPRQ